MDAVLGALGVLKGNPEQTRIVTPYADGIKAFTAFLSTAKQKLRTMIYADTLEVYFDAVHALKTAGVDIKIIFDHSQERGHYEHPQILKLISAGWKDGVDFVVGTSPEAHQIIHIKATWIDGRWVEDGSLNYSPSAFKQVNTVTFSDWPEYAAYLDGIFETQWKFILEHESQYQEAQA